MFTRTIRFFSIQLIFKCSQTHLLDISIHKVMNYSKFVLFFPVTIVLSSFLFVITACFLIYILVYLISCLFSNYGKFLNYHDVWHDEELVNSIPQSSLVVSLTLNGDLSLAKLNSVFIKNVLNASSKNNPQKLRYPELTQYLTTFICLRIWKADPNFLVDNHIVEVNWNGTQISSFYQEYQNKPYERYRSPWEIILIRNVDFAERKNRSKTLLLFKIHHVMADAKSVLKLLVECLGNKPLKTATPQNIEQSSLKELCFLLKFPWNLIVESSKLLQLVYSTFDHPWKLHESFGNSESQKSNTVVVFSPKIYIPNLKQIAKENIVKTSAVVMSIIAGAVGKYSGTNMKREISVGYTLPKPKHPDCLTNHAYSGIIRLPVDQQCSLKRIQECNKEFVRVKEEQLVRYTNVVFFMSGIQIYPITRWTAVNALIPIAITNIAGEEDGFFVGDVECEDFRMSAGTMPGAAGVLFCCISYNDNMQIAVVAKESVLSKEITECVANQIEFELKILMRS